MGLTDAVEEYVFQLAVLGIQRADQHGLARVAHGDALPLDDHKAVGYRLQQHGGQVRVQQVDVVDVQDAAMRRRQQA
jgi:hypothetical protein